MSNSIGAAEIIHCPEKEGYFLVYKNGRKDFMNYQLGEVCNEVRPKKAFYHPIYGQSYYVEPDNLKLWTAKPRVVISCGS